MFIFLSSLLPVGLSFYVWGTFGGQWPGHTRSEMRHCAVVIIVRVDGSGLRTDREARMDGKVRRKITECLVISSVLKLKGYQRIDGYGV